MEATYKILCKFFGDKESLHTQLSEYFNGRRKVFERPFDSQTLMDETIIKHHCTDFQKKVWSVLCDIPYGQTIGYKELALKIGHPKAYRAVGMACHNNPFPVIIPCHRVVGSNGSLTGYALGLEMKKRLIELEKQVFM